MKLPTLLQTAMLVVAVFLPTAATPAEPDAEPAVSAPRLLLHDRVHDFGRVKPGGRLTWAFTFRNVGNADLLIHDVTAD
jgi:uncharacterized protein DUF1573